MAKINNVTRLLDAKKIPYSVFELPEEKLGGIETARLLGVNANLVYKTIVVVRGKGKPLLVVIPSTHRVDLKTVASAIGEKKVDLPTERQAEQLTSLQAGGISPLALVNKGFQVIIAHEAQQLSHVHISGGQRGLNIRMAVADLKEITHATFAQVSVLDERAD